MDNPYYEKDEAATNKPAPKRSMGAKALRFFVWSVLTLLLVAFIATNLLIIWVASGPRSLKQFVPEIESRINQSQDMATVKMGDVQLVWDGFKHPITAQFKQVHVYNKRGKELASFEEVSGSANIPALFTGKLRLSSIGLYKPEINLYRKIDGSFALDLGQSLSYGPDLPMKQAEEKPLQPLAYYVQQWNIPEIAHIREFRIINGVMNIGDTLHGAILTLNDTNIDMNFTRTKVQLNIAAEANQGESNAGIYFRGIIPYRNFAASGKLTVKDFIPSMVAGLHEDLKPLSGVNVPITGTVDGSLDAQGHVQQGHFKLAADKGTVESDQLDGTLPITTAALEGDIQNGNLLHITELKMDMGGVVADAEATLWYDAKKQLGIQLKATTGKTPVDRVKLFWPPWQSPESREWVISNISKGYATQASLQVHIKPGQLALAKLPNEAVKGDVIFEQMNVKYKAEHPEVRQANGVIHINANELEVLIDKGSYLTATDLTKARVFIEDLNADNPNIQLSFHAAAPAADIATMLAFPDIALADRLGITPENLKGSGTADADLSFNFYAPRDDQGNIKEDELIRYKVNANLADMSEPDFLHQYDISHATGALYADNAYVSFKGKAELFGDAMNADVAYYFHPADNKETTIAANGSISSSTLQKIGVNVETYASGMMPFEGSLLQRTNGDMALDAKLDMHQATMAVPEVGWKKASGSPATLALNLTTSGDQINISRLNLSAADAKVDGAMQLGAGNQLIAFHGENVELGDNRLASVDYAPIAGGYKIHATGSYVDLSEYMEARKKEDKGFSFKDIPALDLQLNIDQVKLADARILNQLKGAMICNISICPSANFTGNFADSKSFTLSISGAGSKRNLRATAEDAGGFLNGFDIYNNMIGGRLNLEGYYDDSKAGSPLFAKLHIWDFQVKGTPVLARLLTLASFGGILDTLQGKGIVFDKFSTDITLLNDVVTVKDLKNIGSSIGLSADGTINLKQNTINLKGTIVPSYTINSMLKDVPIVGDILTGGEGIIAAVYTMEGDLDDPNVSVNPLSILTPGFLRKMFE